jgi:protocadherin Fat 1/2/3
LDRESVASYQLKVVATDGTFITSCRVTIEILDDNDSPPVCSKFHYKDTVSESALPGTYILSVTATDADEGINAKQVPTSENFFLRRRRRGKIGRTVCH